MRLVAIHFYPVKGLRGVSVPASSVEAWGLAGDRRWMVVDSAGRLISQREAPGLALIEAAPEGDDIRLSAPSRPSIIVTRPFGGPPVEVHMWRERVPALLAGDEANDWLSSVRGTLCQLVYMDKPAQARPVGGTMSLPGDRVSFADTHPLLLTNDASLSDLASRSTVPSLLMDRFRSNLVVEGAPRWVEDGWRELTIGAVRFAVAGACERCIVTSIDQATGERHQANEPLRTLLSFRRNARGRPTFGVNLIPRGTGTIVVNDAVTPV